MIGFCIDASHQRGLGHLFKTLCLVEYLRERSEPYLVMVNDDPSTGVILKQKDILNVTVNLDDVQTDWETAIIAKYGITVWINDRMDTDITHAANVKKNGVKLVTFDDRGTGGALADLHFAPLVFAGRELLQGKRVLTGTEYLPLSKEIALCKRLRYRTDSILVTMGGSDTYGVTLRIVALLKKLNRKATIVVGQSFGHATELNQMIDNRYVVKNSVPSLIQEYVHHDLAITGGGVTPFEANASGLPCIIVASEPHEVEIGQYLETTGSSVFAGYYSSMDENIFDRPFDLKGMSQIGMEKIRTNGAENIFREVKAP